MKLTVMTADDRIIVVEVDNDETVENVKALLEVETMLGIAQQELLFNGTALPNNQRLNAAGVKDIDLLLLTLQQPPALRAAAAAQAPTAAAGAAAAAREAMAQREDGTAVNPEAFRQHVLGDHDLMARLLIGNPELAHAIRENRVDQMQEALRFMHRMSAEMRRKEQEEQELLSADPFDPDVQRKIEQRIQQANIDDNYAAAYEHSPEQFIPVHMLYVDMEVNGFPLKAFVDSGAQHSIMSEDCALRCGLTRLIDQRHKGIARGVGVSNIVGRIHSVQLKIGTQFFMCSISVIEAQNVEFLFGLDMLRRHQCCIDLKHNVLRVGTGEIAVPFLSEKDIPSSLMDLDKDMPPNAAAPAADAAAAAAPTPPSTSQPPASAPAPASAAPPAAAAAAAPPPTAGSAPAQPLGLSTTPGQAAAAPGAAAVAANSTESKVQRLMELGFPRGLVTEALMLTAGNEDQAASLLFSR